MSQDNEFVVSGPLSLTNLAPQDISFFVPSSEEPIVQLKENGEIWVKGKMVEKDDELVTGLREWLMGVRGR